MWDLDTVRILLKGVSNWNRWREAHPEIKPDLSGFNANFFSHFPLELRPRKYERPKSVPDDICFTDPYGAKLVEFRGANFSGSNLRFAVIDYADLRNADFSDADLSGSSIRSADCSEAVFYGTNLKYSSFVATNVSGARFSHCYVYGTSVWNVEGKSACEENLIITHNQEPTITVDSLNVAQFRSDGEEANRYEPTEIDWLEWLPTGECCGTGSLRRRSFPETDAMNNRCICGI